MALVKIEFDTSNPQDLETLLKVFGSAQGDRLVALDPAAKKAEKAKPGDKPKEEPKTDDIASALTTEKVDREACLVLAKTKTGVKDLLAKMEAKEGKLSNLPDDQLPEFYKLCKALPNK